MKPVLNTAENIAAELRVAILRGQLTSHTPLRQDKIAAAFGVSKIPVREALVQLKAEGLVMLHPNRGAVVTALTAAEAHEIYTIRVLLEGAALTYAMPYLTPPMLLQAENVLRVMDIEQDIVRWAELNWEFHVSLYQAAAMPRLMAMLEPLHMNVARYLVFYLNELGFQAASQQEHYALLAACREKNLEHAVNTLTTHLQTASTTLVAYLNQLANGE